jgi:diguanylate cyclase (GGDEF)-like protein
MAKREQEQIVARPAPPVLVAGDPDPDLARLGEAMKKRVEEVLERTVALTAGPDHDLDTVVQESFESIGRSSTIAVARWIAGEAMETAIEAGRDTWEIFGEIAVRRAATLDEVTWRCFWWRNAMAEVLRETAAELGIGREPLAEAMNRLQLSLEFSLLRMAECFEAERQRTDEELAHREEELSFLATHDPLTGLPNRTLILDRVEQTLARSRRGKVPCAALFIDLDNFKDINDTLGHSAGDELLEAVAARLAAVVREADALGRLGGDEFVVISEDLSLDVGPELVAERLLEALKGPFQLAAGRVTVTASVGIAIAEGETAAEDLLRNADIAMYRAKWDGRDRYSVFEIGMAETVKKRMELEMDLREALELDQFYLVYQPTIDLIEMRPSGVEALIRWRHPERGVLQPESFIPLLEESGLIAEIGAWVLRRACLQAAQWRAAGHSVSMAVNVSSRQLDSDDIIADVEAALEESGLEAEALTIEVTETALMRDVDETSRRLTAIKALGVRIAIDDFGTGYSSFGHLQRFPVDALKIDQSFISGMKRSKEGETLIRTLVQLGKSLHLQTFAEGIEHEDELALLKDEDCDSGQGFLFARPLDAAATEEFLRAQADQPRQAPLPLGPGAASA